MRRSTRRRTLLAAMAAGGIGGVAGTRAPGDELVRRLAEASRHPESACEVGHAYLAVAPAEADRAQLAAALCADPDARARVLAATPAELRRMLGAAQRDDFRAGRTVTVRGWVLSRTEARLGALVALA